MAKGTVLGRVYGTVTQSVCRNSEKIFYGERIVDLNELKIFSFSINIYKRYSNLPIDCDIIEETTPLCLFGRDLPIRLNRIFLVKKTVNTVTYTDEEMVSLASDMIAEHRAKIIGEGELLSIRTYGGFSTPDVYKMTSEFRVLRKIGAMDSLLE